MVKVCPTKHAPDRLSALALGVGLCAYCDGFSFVIFSIRRQVMQPLGRTWQIIVFVKSVQFPISRTAVLVLASVFILCQIAMAKYFQSRQAKQSKQNSFVALFRFAQSAVLPSWVCPTLRALDKWRARAKRTVNLRLPPLASNVCRWASEKR